MVELQEVVKRRQLTRGFLVAIEGIDGAGKTTQSQHLARKLADEGYCVTSLHEPTDGRWGREIKELAKNGRHKTDAKTELEFFILDRKEDVMKNIKPALQGKEIVIMDRYYFSSVTYQGVRDGGTLDPDWIEKENIKIAPVPDITIILDLKVSVALSRIKQKRNSVPNHFEKEKYLKKVRSAFLDQFSGRPNVRIIEGDDLRSIDEIASTIWKTVKPMIKAIEEP